MKGTHCDPHPLAGKVVKLSDRAGDAQRGIVVPGAEFRVEDWWDRLTGKSWMFSDGNPAALWYACRSVSADLPLDDEVLYGHIGEFGHLVHASEVAA